ncbi:enoyl-CoA hydratase [Salicola sp. Rm-C-2C1-2]|uniref:enoyl-CoA hydratase n=1 Tax=Salicola sp. Rm-C-2C1-2 TaxID=3141321 RepID=UPI0032E37E4D
MTDHITQEKSHQILILRINRPDQKNALTHAMYTALADGVAEGHNDPAIRAILIAGNSECFTAGNDLSEFENGLPDTFQNTPVGRFLFALAEATKPIVAAANGPAVGIGTTLLLHCDLAWAGSNTTFRMPFTNLGLCAEGASSLLLPRWLGRVRAGELLLLGRPFDAEKAERYGLINGVCDPSDTETTAWNACLELAALPPAALRATKELMNAATAEEVSETMEREGQQFAQRLESPEATEAFAAFKEKRAPDFTRFN